MSSGKGRYIPALDGLRAIAVVWVIAYHMGFPWAKGGLLGVTVFFVLSGFLITGLLLIEWDSTGGIDLKSFWLRRIKRLFPAIVVVLVVSAALFTVFDHELLTKLRSDLLPASLWFTNWWYIVKDVSYFEAAGAPSPVTHFWSLAIEEQFYLAWPVVLSVVFKFGAEKKAVRRATLILAIASALLMALLYDPAQDPSRVYYGTDTRAFSLLVGAWLAFAWPSQRLSPEGGARMTRRDTVLFDMFGVAALVGLCAMVAFVDEYSPTLYEGGLFAASLLAAAVIAVASHPRSSLGKALGNPAFVWIGKRSYGMYLWHYPILLLMNPRNAATDPGLVELALQAGVIVAVSALSYRFVEEPLRKLRAVDAIAWAKGLAAKRQGGRIRAGRGVACAALSLAIAVFAIAAGGLALVPDTSALGNLEAYGQQASASDDPAQEGQDAPDSPSPGADEQFAEDQAIDPLLIGDSVSLRTSVQFEEAYPDGFLDARVGRQLSEGEFVYDVYQGKGVVGERVVIALGSNGTFTVEQLSAFVEKIGADRKVFLVNVRTPNAWESSVNEVISKVAERYDNATLIDWHAASAGHSEYFDGDGTHLTEEGCAAYVGLIESAVGPAS